MVRPKRGKVAGPSKVPKSKGLYCSTDSTRLVDPLQGKPLEAFRSPWRQDIARLIHSPAFRRLQGKTQVFPRTESDFVRTRLTHSLEVAQIAKSIAIKLNAVDINFSPKKFNISPEIVEFAGLAHDLGHPPFGHNGESALDECMLDFGGFEGNAQTLRILAKLEKKQLLNGGKLIEHAIGIDGADQRCGLNLTARTLASVLKYDYDIPISKNDRRGQGVQKGYYEAETSTVNWIKRSVANSYKGYFKTIECSIMDLADDIAYATYDIEDVLKIKFLRLIDFLNLNDQTIDRITKIVTERSKKYYPDISSDNHNINPIQIISCIINLLNDILPSEQNVKDFPDAETISFMSIFLASGASNNISNDGYTRTKFTSELVQKYLDSIEVLYNEEFPSMSSVRIQHAAFIELEVLKNLTYCITIDSAAIKTTEYRAIEIVNSIFQAIVKDDGHKLLPEDFRIMYNCMKKDQMKKRLICDYIAGMTDEFAADLYDRLFSSAKGSIFRGMQ
jgi:dGTPase